MTGIVDSRMQARTASGYFGLFSIISALVGVVFFCGCLIFWWWTGVGRAVVLFGMVWLLGGLANSLAFLVLHRMDSA